MPHRIAGIDVHKKKLAVVVADVSIHDEYKFERRWYGSHPEHLRALAEWLIEQKVEEAVMESTARHWKPVWEVLERYWKISLSEAGRCKPQVWNTAFGTSLVQSWAAWAEERFRDAERLVKRLISRELILSFVPDPDSGCGGVRSAGSPRA